MSQLLGCNGEEQKECKYGTKCKTIRIGKCKFSHPRCKNGVYCHELPSRDCGYYHPQSHFDATEDVITSKRKPSSSEITMESNESLISNYSLDLSAFEDEHKNKPQYKLLIDNNYSCPFGKDCQWYCHIGTQKFKSGTFRHAFRGHYCYQATKHGKKFGQKCIIKKWKYQHILDENFWIRDIQACKLAQELCDTWNNLSGLAENNHKCFVLIPMIIDYEDPNIVNKIYNNNNENDKEMISHTEKVIIEDDLGNNFVKFNSNSGWFGYKNSIMQTFCHWTYEYSQGKILFCDAQGIQTKNGTFYLTDPCILSLKPGRYGAGDCGPEYIKNWFKYHKCNKYCQTHWRKPVIGPNKTIIPNERSTFVFTNKI